MALERYLALPAEHKELNTLIQGLLKGAESYDLETHLEEISWNFITLYSGVHDFPYRLHLAMPEGLIKLEELEIAPADPEKVNVSFKGFVPKKPEEKTLVLNINNQEVNGWGFRSLVIKSNGRQEVSADELGVDSLRVFANGERDGRGKSRVLTQVMAINQEGIEPGNKNLISEAVVLVGCYGRTHDGRLISGFVVEKPKKNYLPQNFYKLDKEAYKNFLRQRLIGEKKYPPEEIERMVEAACPDLS